jgi:hypothetical protein
MRECPFCREQIQDGAIKCRYCQSMLIQVTTKPEPSSQGQVTYVVDRGLVTYLKVAGGVLAIIFGIGAFVFGLDFTKGRKEVGDLVASMNALVKNQEKEFQARQKDLAEQLTIAVDHGKKLSNTVTEIEQLRARAEAASKKAEDNERAMDARIKQLVQERPSGVSEVRVRHIV